MENYIATYSISASSLAEIFALLTEMQQRTGISPETVRLPDGRFLCWNKALALKVITGKLDPDRYISTCSLEK